ncbi:DNA/RNA non-specific endonuclease, partial [Citrobacter sp. VF227]
WLPEALVKSRDEIRIILVAGMMLLPVTDVSATLLSPADRNIIQQQQQLLNENQRQREDLERSIPLPASATPAIPSGAEGPCFTITRIDIEGATKLSTSAAKAKGCEARGDCKQIVKEVEELSLKQQQEMIAVCATNPAACKEKYGDIPAKGMLVREAIDRVLGADVPSAMKNDMSSLLAQQIEAEGVVTSTEFASQLQNRYGMDKQQAEILAVAALGVMTGGMGKSGTSTTSKNIVVVDSGKKGAWNQAMNKPEPNTVYKVDGNKTFQTDALGRTSSAEGILVASKSDRNTYQQYKTGKCGSSGDEGGHLIASIFNGPGEKLNLVPMDGNLNKGVWKQMENTWANALKDGKQVNVKIEHVYIGENKRPDSFSVTILY